MAWLPFSIAEAALSGHGRGAEDLSVAWAHLLDRLKTAGDLVASSDVNRNRVDYASGMRHLMVLLAVGVDEALRVDPDPVLAVTRTSTDDILTWGMECPDCIYLRATLRGGETYRLFGNRGTAQYVGLQTMNGIVSTTNCLVDDLEVDADGNFEVVLSADEHKGNWMRVEGDHPTLVVRHFFYDWDSEKPSSLQIERIGDEVEPTDRSVAADVAVSRQIYALGEFVHDNLKFFLDFNAGPAGQRVHAADRPLRHRRRGGEPARHRPLRTRTRRGIDPGGRATQGGVLELLARQSMVGDHSLRAPSVQPQRASGSCRPRRHSACRHQLRAIPAWRIGLIRLDIAMAQ